MHDDNLHINRQYGKRITIPACNDAGEVISPEKLCGVTRADGTFVYVIDCVGSGFVKIGSSANLRSRVSALQTAVPFDLLFVFATRLSAPNHHIQAEIRTHDMLAEYHHKGEWFKVTPEHAIEAVRSAKEFIEQS